MAVIHTESAPWKLDGSQKDKAEMSLINDYTHQLLTDQRQRDFARVAETDRQVRLALSGRVSWWRRLFVGIKQRIMPMIMSIGGSLPDNR
jgi:hypothetical protein